MLAVKQEFIVDNNVDNISMVNPDILMQIIILVYFSISDY